LSYTRTSEGQRMNLREFPWRRMVVLFVGAAAIALLYVLFTKTELALLLTDPQALHRWVRDVGWLGPVALMGLMALAIVVSPLPSAPIALAAGAAYGHIWGTVYVTTGALAGALTAFGIARVLGGEAMQRWFGDRLSVGLLGSQNRLMLLVFGLRLLPFVSFDLVSYAAGLTPLATWRFALASLAGIVPISFLLTHFGDRLVGEELESVALAILALGLVTGVFAFFAGRYRGRRR